MKAAELKKEIVNLEATALSAKLVKEWLSENRMTDEENQVKAIVETIEEKLDITKRLLHALTNQP